MWKRKENEGILYVVRNFWKGENLIMELDIIILPKSGNESKNSIRNEAEIS